MQNLFTNIYHLFIIGKILIFVVNFVNPKVLAAVLSIIIIHIQLHKGLTIHSIYNPNKLKVKRLPFL